MLIMALDHLRDYFHYSVFFYDPSDPVQTTWPIYLTRFVTHFCASAFSFLAGLSAFMVGKWKSKNELSSFLLKRGLRQSSFFLLHPSHLPHSFYCAFCCGSNGIRLEEHDSNEHDRKSGSIKRLWLQFVGSIFDLDGYYTSVISIMQKV